MLNRKVNLKKSDLFGQKKKSLYRGAIVAVLAATTAMPAMSGQLLDDSGYSGGKARVNKSASLRSLSEQLASASCRLNAGIEADTAHAHLSSSRNQFHKIIAALETGNLAMGIPDEETRSQTLNAIGEVNEVFATVEGASDNLLDGNGSADDAALIAAKRADLFDRTFVLAAEVSGQYSDPLELLQSDAITLDFAGRQRAMVHRIARNVCELNTGTGTAETLAELERTVSTIENTLIALRDGLPAAAINEPPTEAVKASLNEAYLHWTEERAFLNPILEGNAPSEAVVIEAASFAQSFNVEMNNTITLYLIGSPGQDGVYKTPLEHYARDQLAQWVADDDLLAALKSQNVAHADLTEEQIIAMDQDWRAQAKDGGGPLISQLLEHPVSSWLRDQQTATTGFVTEVFVMDNKGLNVAQSVETSDYWQGDEAKWQETYQATPDALHISEIEFDDSTGFYQAQASLPISDPATNEVIGAITFGINVQSLM